MLPFKRELDDGLSLIDTPPEIQEQLAHWEHLVFSFDMDGDSLNTSGERRSRHQQRSRSASASATLQPGNTSGPGIQDAALLARFAAAAGSGMDLDQSYSPLMSPGQYPSMGPAPGFYGNFLHDNGMAAPQLPPLSSLDFPWSHLPPHQQAGPSHYDPRHGASSSAIPPMTYGETDYGVLPASNQPSSSRNNPGGSSHPPPPPPPAVAASSPDSDPTDADQLAISDEKRRRNTAASARFRIKKKQKTINLERSVSDLTGRAEELEREVADLRRENGWLKEIVMLKGTQFAASNMSSSRFALSQAAFAATGGPPVASSSNLGAAGSSISASDAASDGSSSEDHENDEKRKKKKTKSASKRKQ